MFEKLKISTKLIVLVFLLVAVGVVSESLISYYNNKKSLETEHISKLRLLSTIYEQNVNNQIEEIKKEMEHLQKNNDLLVNFSGLEKYTKLKQADTAQSYKSFYTNSIFDDFQTVRQYKDIYLLNTEEIVLYQYTDPSAGGEKFQNMDNKIIDLHLSKFHINKPIFEDKEFYTYLTNPIIDNNGKNIGVIVCKLKSSTLLNKATPKINDVERTTEILTFKLYKNNVYKLSNSSMPSKSFFNEGSKDPVFIASDKMASIDATGLYKTPNDIETLALWKHIDYLGIGLLIKTDQDEVYESLQSFSTWTLVSAIIILILSLILSNFFSKILTFPILKLKKVLGLVSHGILPRELKTPLQDEIGDMIMIVNKIVKSLKKTAAFAQKIGEGDFETNFRPISNKDTLGHALVNMRESLQTADTKDNLRNWIVTGVAEIGEILRNNDTLTELGDDILDYLCKRINTVQGAFYVINNDDNNQFIDITASYAYEKKKYLKGRYKFAEGLIGQAAIEKDIIVRSEIPENYTSITSGLLGDKTPSSLIIVPLITNEIVYGIIELASFNEFSEGETQFMQEVSEIIARTIFNIKVNENTKNLLEESQRMSSELKVQQEELKQNAIKMESSQKEIQSANEKLEKQITEVNNAQNRIQKLLQNASEVIIIYDDDGSVRYVSPSVEPILDYEQEDLIGKQDINLVNTSEQPIYRLMFENLIKHPQKTEVIQISFFKKTGDLIWLEATGRNLINDPAIQGIVVNYRDITERRRAEEEEKKRGQMQALSENSTDLITRISDKRKFFYINPTITVLTGKTQEEFLNKSIEEIDISQNVRDAWKNITDEVFSNGKKVSKEISFPSVIGDRIMQMNAIPEFGMNEQVNSILLVAHDITEAKQIENEIKDKNQKINDSINYAENIQEVILPDNSLVRKALPQSFIYFKPRDVVSGDFPWFAQKGDDIFIAAVDCTGHGVPGALISLVGYFLLNNIIEHIDGANAGQVLDLLDHAVTETFKQNLDSSKIKDGMDIALCKINTKTQNIEYAGANRPLYHISTEGTLNEYKGDKFPIGGGKAYANKTKFTTNTISYTEGESIYFFSDGFPDQFGGVDSNQKFGTKRIKQIVEKKTNSIDEILVELNNQFEDWKSQTKQTDDVLLIGIRF